MGGCSVRGCEDDTAAFRGESEGDFREFLEAVPYRTVRGGRGEDEEKSTATGAKEFPAARAGGPGGGVGLIDEAVADAGGQ